MEEAFGLVTLTCLLMEGEKVLSGMAGLQDVLLATVIGLLVNQTLVGMKIVA